MPRRRLIAKVKQCFQRSEVGWVPACCINLFRRALEWLSLPDILTSSDLPSSYYQFIFDVVMWMCLSGRSLLNPTCYHPISSYWKSHPHPSRKHTWTLQMKR